MRNERELVNKVYTNLKQNKPYRLKKVEKFLNLTNRGFEGTWTGWYKGETPPKLEVDMVTVFEDISEKLDDALIIAIEMKFFKDFKNRGFFEGLEKILAYSLFGFDGLSLWHLFSKDLEDDKIKNFATSVKEVINGFNLPLFYICGTIIDEEKLKIKYFDIGSYESEIKSILDWMCNFIGDKRNPLLFENKFLIPNFEEIKNKRNSDASYSVLYSLLMNSNFEIIRKRRRTLKVILKIP